MSVGASNIIKTICEDLCQTAGILYHVSGMRFEVDTIIHRSFRWFMMFSLLYLIVTNEAADFYIEPYVTNTLFSISFHLLYLAAVLCIYLVPKLFADLLLKADCFRAISLLDLSFIRSQMRSFSQWTYWGSISSVAMMILASTELALNSYRNPQLTVSIKLTTYLLGIPLLLS